MARVVNGVNRKEKPVAEESLVLSAEKRLILTICSSHEPEASRASSPSNCGHIMDGTIRECNFHRRSPEVRWAHSSTSSFTGQEGIEIPVRTSCGSGWVLVSLIG